MNRVLGLIFLMCVSLLYADPSHKQTVYPVTACLKPAQEAIKTPNRVACALDWQPLPYGVCRGYYKDFSYPLLPENDTAITIDAEHAALHMHGESTLSGNVVIRQTNRIVTAPTALIWRNAKTEQVERITLLDGVRLEEPDMLAFADHALIYPQDRTGTLFDVLYRYKTDYAGASLPARGAAQTLLRQANADLWLEKASYTTCSPEDATWKIAAKKLRLIKEKEMGEAYHAVFYVHDIPVFYWPYAQFPTSKKRRSGFLLPSKGYSNVGGFDLRLPYYFNLARHYDMTLAPHWFTRRGLMMENEWRYLSSHTQGVIQGTFLERDKAFQQFLRENNILTSDFSRPSANRWSFAWTHTASLQKNMRVHVQYQKVSDDYYLQDFMTNLALVSERQILQQIDVLYTSTHWVVTAMLQGYQTLEPINQLPLMPAYERMPNIMAHAYYDKLPGDLVATMHNSYDYFRWPEKQMSFTPEAMLTLQSMMSGHVSDAQRVLMNPSLSRPRRSSWGYITPGAEVFFRQYTWDAVTAMPTSQFSTAIPGLHVDTGLAFEREGRWFRESMEPRLFYLYVPWVNQSAIPVFDTNQMIFNYDQLFRVNRFAGYDRIGDANQLAAAVTWRWFSQKTQAERAAFSLGQLYYFATRRVGLCFAASGVCQDTPWTAGYLSPEASVSPLAARFVMYMNTRWSLSSDYVWDPYTGQTNNTHMDVRYHGIDDRFFSLGYTYLVSGDTTQVFSSAPDPDPMHQITATMAWPLQDRWRGLGIYSYNISKRYDMTALAGVEYASCCWAVRVMGGRTLQSLNGVLQPNYNNNVYLQILWKGLGALGTSDPGATLATYMPNVTNRFH